MFDTLIEQLFLLKIFFIDRRSEQQPINWVFLLVREISKRFGVLYFSIFLIFVAHSALWSLEGMVLKMDHILPFLGRIRPSVR